MLTPAYLEGLPDPILELYAQIEDEILRDMARRIATYDYWIPAADWQNMKLKETGRLQEDILRILAAYSGKTEEELRALMQQATTEGLRSDIAVYEAHGETVPPINESQPLVDTLNAGYRATRQTMRNLTRTTARTATQQFERELDAAWLQVSSGAFSTEQATRHAVKRLAARGVEAIRYPSGHTDTLEVAVRRAVVTGVNKTTLELQDKLAEEVGCELVEVTAHEGARPSHAEWQGKIFCRSGTHPRYPSLEEGTGYGTGAGLGGWNCRHSFHPWFEGSPRTWTDEQLEKLKDKTVTYNGEKLTEYEASQKQRYIEQQIRKWKREAEALEAAGLDPSEAKAKVRHWQATMRDFAQQTGLKRQSEREQISSGAVKNTPAPVANSVKSGIISIEADGMTPCLVDTKTGEVLSTTASRVIDLNELRGYTKKSGWFINWHKMAQTDGVEVYKLVLDKDKSIQGLIAITPQRGYVQMNWGVANPLSQSNRVGAEHKQYTGIGGHLFAIAAQRSIELGNGGYLMGKAASQELLEYYCSQFGAVPLPVRYDNNLFTVDEEAAQKIAGFYTFDWG